MTRRLLSLVGGLCLVLALVGCTDDGPATPAASSGSSGSSTSSAPPSSSPPASERPTPSPSTTTIDGHRARYLGPVTSPHRQVPPGLLLEPPPADATPEASWTEAFAGCFRGIRCVTTGEAEVVLALVTGPGNAAIGGRSMFDRTLAYVVTWDPGPCYTMRADSCRVVNLVTAEPKGSLPAGTALYAFEVTDDATA